MPVPKLSVNEAVIPPESGKALADLAVTTHDENSKIISELGY